ELVRPEGCPSSPTGYARAPSRRNTRSSALSAGRAALDSGPEHCRSPASISGAFVNTTTSKQPTSAFDRFFRISERGSTIGTEVRGGLVTFVTMAYIVILNPIILSGKPDVAGNMLDFGAVGAVTALTAGVMTILFGLIT